MKTLNFPLKSHLALALITGLVPNSLFASSPSAKQKEKLFRDIGAIGHRDLGCSKGPGNWYSAQEERELGAKLAASLEQSNPILRDSEIAIYLDHLTQVIANNSDAKFPITVRVIDEPEPYTVTLPGGYQYITRGLLFNVQSEGELAAALARGIAHSSLCSESQIQTRANLAEASTIPLIFVGGPQGISSKSGADASVPLTLLKFRRDFERWADYFGVQYLYKSGYDPECFVHFVRMVWPPPTPDTPRAFSSFPPVAERLKALEKEIAEILPKRDGQVTNTAEFLRFREHLLRLNSRGADIGSAK